MNGEILKQYRHDQGFTQNAIANKVGISIAFYSMIENNRRRPSAAVARRIAEVLGFPNHWYYLLEDSDCSDCPSAL